MKRLLLSLLPLVLAACAAAPDTTKEVALAPMDKDTICERETSTGTSLPKTRCRTAEQRKQEQEQLIQAGESRHLTPPLTTGK